MIVPFDPQTFLGRAVASLCSRAGVRNLTLLALLALLVLSGQARYAPAQQVYTAELMDSWVFQQDGNAAGARRRLDSHLTIHLDEIQLACKLTEEQRKRLLLAGHGDIKRFFDRYETLRRSFKPIRQDQPDFQQVYQELWQRISPLQASLRDGLFQADSLFGKILPSTLTTAQKASYDALLNERHQFQFRNSVAQVVHALDQSARLTQAQRRQLTELLSKELKAPKKSGPYDQYYFLWQLGRLPDERMRLLFDDVQRKAIDAQLQQAQNVAQSLRRSKVWPGDEDEESDDKPVEPKPAVLRKK
jgi:hypothetical protein